MDEQVVPVTRSHLTNGQHEFLRLMLADEHMDKVTAYMSAYNCTKAVAQNGCNALMQVPFIKEILAAEVDARLSTCKVTKSRVIAELAKVAFGEVSRGHLTNSDKITALKELGKYLNIAGMMEDKPVNEGVTYVFQVPLGQPSSKPIELTSSGTEALQSEVPETVDLEGVDGVEGPDFDDLLT